MRPPSQPPSTASARAEILPGIWLDGRLALWLPAERLLIVADLHWGYSASHRARGNLLPIWGDDEIAQRLRALIADYQPAEMLWLGDTVHAAEGAARAEQFIRESPAPIVLLAGNHDRRWRNAGEQTLRRGNWFFHHGDRTPTVPEGCIEIIGHHHPAVSWSDGAGTRLKRPALVVRRHRLILPAFSPWAAGTPWNDSLAAGDTLWIVTPNRIFALPPAPPAVRPTPSTAA